MSMPDRPNRRVGRGETLDGRGAVIVFVLRERLLPGIICSAPAPGESGPHMIQSERGAVNRQFEVARANLARMKPPAALNALSQKDLDDATGSSEIASAAVGQARA
jgi:hypothetical protein